ncbi:MAG: NADH-quinone oxidoreductase subunit M [Myxococcota bacterium]
MADSSLLTAVVFAPALGALLLTLFPSRDHNNVKATALGISTAVFLLSTGLWLGFDPTQTDYQFAVNVPWVEPLGIGYRIGIDGISLVLIVLTTFLCPITLLGAWSAIQHRVKEFAICMLVLECGMLGAFVALDLFLFYVFWEAMLIPMYFIIGIWGGKRRVFAAVKFFVFTMAGSLLMLIAILVVAIRPEGWDFSLMGALQQSQPLATQRLLFWAFALAFAVKVPMFPVHTWLPDAHVEAPTPGSVILAGVLLKLGVYGFIRFAFPMFPRAAFEALPILGGLAVAGIIYGALVAWVQADMKKLVAYSSVSHLGFCMLGLAAMTTEGVSGALFVCIAHGVSTGALFMLVGVLYERRHTRIMADYGGIARQVPVFALFLVMTAMASAGLPLLSGFPGEFLVLLGTFTADGPLARSWAILGATGVILAAVYILWMAQKILFGPMTNPANDKLEDMNPREIFSVACLMGASFVLGVAPNLVLDKLRLPVEEWVRTVHVRSGQGAYAPDEGVFSKVQPKDGAPGKAAH